MKNTMRWLVAFGMAAGLAATTGCKTVSTSSHVYLGGTTYPPTDPAQVEILRQEPTRPNVKIGEVKAQPSSDNVGNQQIEQALQKNAAKMGANAVVIVADRSEVVGAILTGPAWSRTMNNISGRVIVGVAIHYTDR